MPTHLCLRKISKKSLKFEPAVDASAIGVAVKDGVATLTGHVASYAEKVAAEHVAEPRQGVRAVAVEIDVRLPFDIQHDDDEIAAVPQYSRWSVILPPTDNVQV